MNELATEDTATEGMKTKGCGCAACQGEQAAHLPEQFIYTIGRMDVRFPTIGIEKEFQQRQRAAELKGELPASRTERIRAVLRENPHLWPRVCFVFSVASVPAYIVTPSSQHTLQQMLEAASRSSDRNTFAVLIGRRVGTAQPGQCGGLLAPIAICDQMYVFSIDEWTNELSARVEPTLKDKGAERGHFSTVAREFFDQVVNSSENIGGMDTHRALNYVLVQHPGLALSVSERPKSVLDRIETRPVQGTDMRRMVAVILTFVSRTTGVPERLFCRVDVTEEWPFLVEDSGTSVPILGLMPYVEQGASGGGF
jgi:hypothetical protein